MITILKRSKPYKAKTPADTIHKIKTILYGLGLQLVEEPVEGNENG